jgi:hypothetical protein
LDYIYFLSNGKLAMHLIMQLRLKIKTNMMINLLTNTIPLWISILFLLAIIIPIFVLANLAKEGALRANLNTKKYYSHTIIFFVIYFLYASLMSFTGIFQENTLPPKIFLFTTIPLFAFFILFTNLNQDWKKIIAHISIQSLVRFHIIRFIGLVFFIFYYFDTLPRYFAITAGLGDVLAAITAIIVVRIISQKHPYEKQITFCWNVFGCIDILNVIISGIILTKLSIETGSKSLVNIAYFPFCLIPAFAPASILFVHFIIFKKILSKNKPV